MGSYWIHSFWVGHFTLGEGMIELWGWYAYAATAPAASNYGSCHSSMAPQEGARQRNPTRGSRKAWLLLGYSTLSKISNIDEYFVNAHAHTHTYAYVLNIYLSINPSIYLSIYRKVAYMPILWQNID